MTRRVYACSRCGTAFFHPLRNCTRCPGNIKPLDLPWDGKKHPQGYFTGVDVGKQLHEWFKENGLQYGGC